MMRITNSMMSTNTKTNINLNKLYEDEKNTQVATGQKISRPSDDPVVAIRALRFNTTLSQLNQYYEKNIPDAKAWLTTTETALMQTDGMYDSILQDLTTGSSDTNTASDRQKILANLKGIREEFYATGNADYAGRTVFTGYRTGESLTFLATDTDLDATYSIREELEKDDVKSYSYITSAADTSDNIDENNVESLKLNRIRLSYDNISSAPSSIELLNSDKTSAGSISVTSVSITGMTQAQIDEVYANIAKETGEKAICIKETGEVILSDTAADKLNAADDAYVDYQKNSWNSGDPRPEHYFACKKQESGSLKVVNYNYDELGNPDFKNQDIEIEVSFNQKIAINSHASDVYSHDIGRDIDDLIKITQDVVDADEKVTKAEKKLSAAGTDAEKAAAQAELDAAKKEFSMKKDKMQKTFSEGLDTFQKYADNNNKVIADIGSTQTRLNITKERVSDQLQSFKELADDNINVNLTDAAIDLSNAELALQAAQMAASKIAQQTLLNYL